MHLFPAAVAPLLVAAGLAGAPVLGSTTATARLEPHGVGAVRFGLAQARAVAALSTLFGRPTWHARSDACGPRFAEVEWGDLAAEFRRHVFSGYRYATHAYLEHSVGAPRSSRGAVWPRLATAKGITLGSTLAQLDAAYGKLHWSGPDKRHTSSGLVFLDNGTRSPATRSSRIIEIKTTTTCGDY